MVTKKSLMEARKDFKKWKHENKKASVKQNIKQLKKAIVEASEVEIGLHTLPSIITPMPRNLCWNLKKALINSRRGERYGRKSICRQCF